MKIQDLAKIEDETGTGTGPSGSECVGTDADGGHVISDHGIPHTTGDGRTPKQDATAEGTQDTVHLAASTPEHFSPEKDANPGLRALRAASKVELEEVDNAEGSTYLKPTEKDAGSASKLGPELKEGHETEPAPTEDAPEAADYSANVGPLMEESPSPDAAGKDPAVRHDSTAPADLLRENPGELGGFGE
jgi:hypothetical protein